VLVNTSSVPNVHSALVHRIADELLGLQPRDWAAEALRQRAAGDSARDAIQKALMAMRSQTPSRVPRANFAGRYENPFYGPISIRSDSSGLTLQMGSGQVADLEYHGADAFYVRWRDPWLRENLTAHLAFTLDGDSVVSFATTMAWDVETADRDALSLQRESITARKPRQAAASAQLAGRADLTGVDAIVGRWNLRMLAVPDVYGSWLEVERSGFNALVGRFVGLIGGAHSRYRPSGRHPAATFAWS
jgi:hypothetical protein